MERAKPKGQGGDRKAPLVAPAGAIPPATIKIILHRSNQPSLRKHQALCFSKNTISTATSAGDTPGIRLAAASDRGRCLHQLLARFNPKPGHFLVGQILRQQRLFHLPRVANQRLLSLQIASYFTEIPPAPARLAELPNLRRKLRQR